MLSKSLVHRAVLGLCALGMISVTQIAEAAQQKPNIVIIFTDDQGYADVGCFGSVNIKTPNLDRMAGEGMRFTDFYVAAPVCTPSRAGLMTGCYPQRLSMALMPRTGDRMGKVLFPDSPGGLNPDEITIPELLKTQGYATGMVGKWHLGHHPEFLPTRHGFDSYYGIPYSNDMIPCPILRNETVVEEPADQTTLTERYTAESVQFIRDHKDEPFFLYLAHNMPHIPLFVSEKFAGTSDGGLYGDVIETIDWGVGQILDTLDELKLSENTLVVFTSDNGPWLVYGDHGGFATPLRAGKGTTYEGGMRVPGIMRWPGTIPKGVVTSEVATTLDLLPTIAAISGAEVPQDRIIDGHNILPLIKGEGKSPTDVFYYYHGRELQAVRSGEWKLRVESTLHYEDIYRRVPNPDAIVPEALYHLPTDPGEQRNLLPRNKKGMENMSEERQAIVANLRALLDKSRTDLGDARQEIAGTNIRPLGSR
jgi:arylsulfatase A